MNTLADGAEGADAEADDLHGLLLRSPRRIEALLHRLRLNRSLLSVRLEGSDQWHPSMVVAVDPARHRFSLDALNPPSSPIPAPGTRIAWTIRGHNFQRIFGGGENDGLAARGALGRRLQALAQGGKLEVVPDFRTVEVRRGDGDGALTIIGRGPEGDVRTIENIDEVIVSAA